MSSDDPIYCPHCDVAMTVSQRHGVGLDICPDCLGIWLDRGEADKIVNRLAVGDPEGFPYLFERDAVDGTQEHEPGGRWY